MAAGTKLECRSSMADVRSLTRLVRATGLLLCCCCDVDEIKDGGVLVLLDVVVKRLLTPDDANSASSSAAAIAADSASRNDVGRLFGELDFFLDVDDVGLLFDLLLLLLLLATFIPGMNIAAGADVPGTAWISSRLVGKLSCIFLNNN